MGDWRDEHGLEDPIARWMRQGGQPVHLDAGAPADPRITGSLCLLTSGWLSRSRRVGDDRTATLATYLPGDVVMLDVWSGAPDGDHLLALTPVSTICRPVGEFEAVLDTDPAIARAVIRRLGGEAGLLRAGLAALGRLDARDRLAVFLRQLHRRLVAGGSLDPRATTFPCPLTQAQLANAIGVTSVHANRVLSELRRAGVLTLSRSEVVVQDWAAFDRMGDAPA